MKNLDITRLGLRLCRGFISDPARPDAKYLSNPEIILERMQNVLESLHQGLRLEQRLIRRGGYRRREVLRRKSRDSDRVRDQRRNQKKRDGAFYFHAAWRSSLESLRSCCRPFNIS